LRGFIAVGIGGDSEICLVLSVPLKVTFGQDEHSPRLQALDKLSNGLGEVGNLRRRNDSYRFNLKRHGKVIDGKYVWAIDRR
jgi:hypothetical protein